MPRLFDPKKATEGLKKARGEDFSAAEIVGLKKKWEAAKPAPTAIEGDPRASTHLSTKKDPMRDDFRVFLTVVWRHLGLGDPSPLQLAMAWWLQHCPHDRVILEAFRGAAKSWITAAYCLWTLHCDPQKRILVVSASKERAIQFVTFCFSLLSPETGVPQLRYLYPKAHQRSSSQSFDVSLARPDQSPSLKAAGITGQITGSRADLIVGDDVEIPQNSMTVVMREKLREQVKEFDAILKPGGKVRFLGTPQNDDSLYPKLEKVGYVCRIFPALYPTKKEVRNYGGRLHPYILGRLKKDARLAGHSTEPGRFTDEDLAKRKRSIGTSTFQLQFMLSTAATDEERYPLKLRDLIVHPLDQQRGPEIISWGNAEDLIKQDLSVLGFEGDKFFGPASVSKEYGPYTQRVAAIDSSGRGDNETALSIGAELNGMVFLLYQEAWTDGYGPATLRGIAQALVRYEVHQCLIEKNFGDGMFQSLLQPVLEAEWKKANELRRRSGKEEGGTELVELTSSNRAQKELRILSVLEPITQSHRLVVNEEVLKSDLQSILAKPAEETRHFYSLQYQLSHITREKDCLRQDDRLESLAMLCAHFAPDLGVEPLGMASRRQQEKIEEDIEKLFADADELGGYGQADERVRPRAALPQAR